MFVSTFSFFSFLSLLSPAFSASNRIRGANAFARPGFKKAVAGRFVPHRGSDQMPGIGIASSRSERSFHIDFLIPKQASPLMAVDQGTAQIFQRPALFRSCPEGFDPQRDGPLRANRKAAAAPQAAIRQNGGDLSHHDGPGRAGCLA